MTLVRRASPLGELVSLRQAMYRLFEDSFVRPSAISDGESQYGFPLDVTSSKDVLVVEAGLPGINPDDVEITVENGTLNIRGESNSERTTGEGENLVREVPARQRQPGHRPPERPRARQGDGRRSNTECSPFGSRRQRPSSPPRSESPRLSMDTRRTARRRPPTTAPAPRPATPKAPDPVASIRPERDPERPVYVISVAATLVSAHPRTLRIYEDEGLLCPARTPSNIRLYSENDIRRITWIRHLTRERGVNLAGIRILF